MTHEVHAENLGAYMLGALPDVERVAFERHLETCGRCRDEVEELRVAADALPRAVEPLTPRPELKASLMEVVEREAAAQAQATRRAEAPRRRWRLSLPTLRPATAALAAAALIGGGVVAGYGLSGAGDEDAARTLRASVDPRAGAARATVTVAPDGGHAVLRVTGMPATGRDSTYQVWLSRDGRVTSQSLFAVGPDGRGAAAVPDRVAGADAVMVTREPAGGSPAPTSRPLLTATL